MFRAVRAIAQRISTLTVASVVVLSSLATAAPLFFSQAAEALALGITPSSHALNGNAYGTSTANASGYTDLVLSFHADGKKLDENTDKLTYGWRTTNGTEHELGVINGITGDGNNTSEDTDVSLNLPDEAATSGLVVYFDSTTDKSNDSDKVEITNITLSGNTTPVVPPVITTPGTPTLVSPAAGANLTALPTNFSWTAAANSVSYEIEFSTSITFGAGVGFTSSTTSLTTTEAVPVDGTYNWRVRGVSSTGHTGAWATGAFTVTTPVVPPAPVDTTKPTITVKPANDSIGYNGVYRKISFKIQDNIGVKRWNINGNAWINVTVDKYGDVNNKYVGSNGIVNGSNVITLEDTSGNATSLTFSMNNVGPTITVKPSSVGSTVQQIFSEVDFALEDPNHVDRVTLNGVEKDLANNQWSDLNNVKPGQFGAVVGINTLIAFDGIGNSTTYVFTLDTSAPQIYIKSADNGYTPFSIGSSNVYSRAHFKLHDNTLIQSYAINSGSFIDVTPDEWSDVNDIYVGYLGATEGWNTITVRDIAGNESSLDFFLDGTAPTLSIKEDYVGDATAKVFSQVSFKLFDANKVDKVVINGIEKDFTDNTWSDANFQNIKSYLHEGSGNVVVLYDVAGNTSTYEFTYDSLAPIVTIDAYTGTDTMPTLTGTVDDLAATVTVAINGGPALTATNNGDGTWSLNGVETLAVGTHAAVVTATDIAGNTATTEGIVTINEEPEENEGEEEGEGEGGFGGGPAINPLDPGVQQSITQSVLAANSAVVRGSNLSFATTQTPGNDGQVQAADTNAVDGAVAENENQTKFVEGANNVFKYWWIILLALLAIIGGIAIAQRKSSNKE